MAYCTGLENRSPRKGAVSSNLTLSVLLPRVSKNSIIKRMDKINLVPIIEDKIREGGEKIKSQKVSVSFNKPETAEIFVNGDKSKISEVIDNLLDNAIKYTPEGGKVEVTLEKNKNSAKVSVTDTGIGISEEEAPHIFSEFFRGEQAKNIHKEGSGLGLFIVKNIIERHKGQVGFAARKDKGATFFFTLPLA